MNFVCVSSMQMDNRRNIQDSNFMDLDIVNLSYFHVVKVVSVTDRQMTRGYFQRIQEIDREIFK